MCESHWCQGSTLCQATFTYFPANSFKLHKLCIHFPPLQGGKNEMLRLVSKPIAFPSSLLSSQCRWWKSIIPSHVSLTKASNKIIKPNFSYHETKYNADVMHLANLTYVMLPKQISPLTREGNTFPKYCLGCSVSLSLPQAPRWVNRHCSKSHLWKDQELNWWTILLASWQRIQDSTSNLYPL